MKIEQKKWTSDHGWTTVKEENFKKPPQLVLVFGGKNILEDPKKFDEMRAMYPKSHLITCSAAGEIVGIGVADDSIALNAIFFEKTELQFASEKIDIDSNNLEVAKKLAKKLPTAGLVHVMVFAEGVIIKASELVRGLTVGLPKSVSVTGGLAGDVSTESSTNFKETLVGLDEKPTSGNIVLVGFYGEHLKIGYGSIGGWDAFGPERLITRSLGNTLYEIDGKPALQLYKEYLGEKAKELPSAGLLFPMNVRYTTPEGNEEEVTRTFFSVDEAEQSMTFVGDMPQGAYAKLMRANFEHIIDGAANAASKSTESLKSSNAELAILISCIGRKLVLKERTEEELEAVQTIIGKQAAMTGFYSYGEICPTAATEKQCQLHNQTMTITTFREE